MIRSQGSKAVYPFRHPVDRAHHLTANAPSILDTEKDYRNSLPDAVVRRGQHDGPTVTGRAWLVVRVRTSPNERLNDRMGLVVAVVVLAMPDYQNDSAIGESARWGWRWSSPPFLARSKVASLVERGYKVST